MKVALLSSRPARIVRRITGEETENGNETADKLARGGGQLDQCDTWVSCQDERTIIESLAHKNCLQEHTGHDRSDSCYKLNRADQVILLRLRTGHSRLDVHLFNKMTIGQSEMCPCNTAPMTMQ